jgi:hypothetical protein
MDNETIAGRKSRIFHQRVGKAPEWRSVGSITIVSPDHDEPLFMKDMAYTIFLHEAKDKALKDAFVVLKQRTRPDIWKFRFWLVAGGIMAFSIARAWYLLSTH